MADVSGFRTKFGGFNKEDVLAYIDSLQEEQARQLEQAEQQAAAQCAAYEKALNEANEALAQQFQALQEERAEQDKLQQLINEQYEANRTLRESAQAGQQKQAEWDDLRDKAEGLQAENGRLQAQLAQSTRDMEALRQILATREQELTALRQKAEESTDQSATVASQQQALQEAAQQMEELQSQLHTANGNSTRLEEQNRQYQKLVGDVGAFVVEVRAMGQRFLEDANTRCEKRLHGLSDAIEALSQELQAAAQELHAADRALEVQNSGAGERLDALARELERSATAFQTAPAETGRFF